jgi:cyclic-di-AMP phosphodiesterase PgpH
VTLLTYIQQKHNLIFKLFLVVVCSFLLGHMLPEKTVKGHKVDSFNAVWPYADLVTDQDFLITKTDEELSAEREKIERETPVFLEQNTTERDQKMIALEKLLEPQPLLYSQLQPLFDSIYSRGVIESFEKPANRQLFVLNGNYAQPGNYNDFFTIRSAAEYLEKNLRNRNIKVNYLDYLAITHFVNQQRSAMYLNSKLEQVSLYRSVIRAGETLVKQGEELNNAKRQQINAYFSFQNKNAFFSIPRFLAKWGLAFILLMVLLVYLAFFRKLVFGQNQQVAFLFLVLMSSVFTVFIFNRYGLVVLALPFALVPILVRVFFDGRTALFTHLMTILFCSFFMPDKIEFILLQLITGIGTLFAVAEMRKRQQILSAAALVFLFYVLIFACYQVGFGTAKVAFKIGSYLPMAISSMMVLLAYPLIYLTEKFFGFISDFKLLELCDLNQPLLRQLSQDVPGTFQHSLQVANLAEEAIYYIGGNALLVRAGAMYHDIGKIYHPNFFTENQAGGFSPHQEMEPIESARIIINHVIRGIELAKENHLPEQVIDFIRTHHGTTSVRYFLNLSKQQGNDSRIAETEFKYPGPIPFSKETAVLMIADGVEAASRSLKSHDAVTINDLVDNIIDYKIGQNQFINSDITFKDITTIKKIFKKRLMNIYHARIEYPA